ncbi:MAG: M23 family metallopeptidase [Brachymonas sp.]|nr:M23 family metallopeptidase [Brachymonas sp.]
MTMLSSPTVLLVSADQTRTVDIHPRLLFLAKPLLVALAAAVTVLLLGLGWLGWSHISANQQHAASTRALQQQVVDLQNFTSAEINAKVEALKKSEQSVQELHNYLNARGVHVKPATIAPAAGKPNPAAGGPLLPAAARPVPFTGSFAQDTQNLLSALERTPLGAPHVGPLTSQFGNRANPFSGLGAEDHGGLDIKGTTGDPVKATANGKVQFAGVQGGYGNVVRINHGNGYETIFGHLSRIDVKTGATIKAGEVLGLLGSTGRSTGPHLHYEVLRNGERLNPELFLSMDTPLVQNR